MAASNHGKVKTGATAPGEAHRKMWVHKGSWYGCQVEKVDRWLPSPKTCTACGTLRETLPQGVRTWACADCREVHDRDVKCSRNRLHQSGVGVTGSNAWGQS